MNSLDVENIVLGTMMSDINNFNIGMGILKIEYFSENNAKIFDTFIELNKKNIEVNIITVIDLLKKTNKLDEIGGSDLLFKLTSNTVLSIDDYCMLIYDNYLSRQIDVICVDGHQRVNNGEDPSDVISDITNTFDRLIDVQSDVKSFIENIEYSLLCLDKRIDNVRNNKFNGITTGSHKLDKMIGGWQPWLICIAGRPQHGKTAWALFFAKNAGINVAFFSLEMTAQQLTDRIILSETDVEGDKYRDGYLSNDELKIINQAAGNISNLKIHIQEEYGLNIAKLKSKIRTLHRKGKCEMVIIDYIQLMNMPNKNRADREIGEITKTLKQLSLELKIPIIILSQLNRNIEKRGNPTPMLSDLKESGDIEQDCDLIIFVSRNFDTNIDVSGILHIAKFRHGKLGKLGYNTNTTMTSFMDIGKRLKDELPF